MSNKVVLQTVFSYVEIDNFSVSITIRTNFHMYGEMIMQ